MNIIGISAFYHESACCLLQEGRLIAAATEERFSRLKHDARLPVRAFRYCLQAGNIPITQVDAIAFYESPDKKRHRQQTMGVNDILREAYMPRDTALTRQIICDGLGYAGPVLFFDHHHSHAASAFFFSGFADAAVLTVDGVGEWATTSYGHGTGADLHLFEEVHFPHSLGLLYATLTAYLGFRVNDGEYKVMGLAAYGRPRYLEQMRQLVTADKNGQFRLNMAYFDFVQGATMYGDALPELFGQPVRPPDAPITTFHHDIACSLQQVLEEMLLEKATYLATQVDSPNLCLAGGVALNCVANARLVKETPFQQVFIQPAAGDEGGCLGAAALAHRAITGSGVDKRPLAHVYLGPQWSSRSIAQLLDSAEIPYLSFIDREADLLAAVVERLIAGAIIGWFHGRMEFGPRALGARSILANPMGADVREQINLKVKRREPFRPFAPSVLAAEAAAHFDLDHPSPFMLETCSVRSPLALPAITHVDGSARPQTVQPEQSPRFAALLTLFFQQTGCPLLLNTSFNVKDDPIVCSPVDALLCFGKSGLDALVLEDCLIDRSMIPANWSTLCQQWAATPPFAFKTAKSILHDTLYTFV